jgi:hypothetical protein
MSVFGGRDGSARPDLAPELYATKHDEQDSARETQDSYPQLGRSAEENYGHREHERCGNEEPDRVLRWRSWAVIRHRRSTCFARKSAGLRSKRGCSNRKSRTAWTSVFTPRPAGLSRRSLAHATAAVGGCPLCGTSPPKMAARRFRGSSRLPKIRADHQLCITTSHAVLGQTRCNRAA